MSAPTRLWHSEPNAINNSVGYAKFHSCSNDAVNRVYNEPANIIDTHKHFAVSLDPETRRCARMVMPLSGDYGCHIVDAGEVFAGISDCRNLKLAPCDPTAPGNRFVESFF